MAACWGYRTTWRPACSTSTACSPTPPPCTTRPGPRCSTRSCGTGPSGSAATVRAVRPRPDYHRVRRRATARGRRARVPGQPGHRAARGPPGRPARRRDRATAWATARTRCCCGPIRPGRRAGVRGLAWRTWARPADAGLRRAVVSSSANTRQVARRDRAGRVRRGASSTASRSRTEHLRGKPAPDTFLAAAERLGVAAGPGARCSRTPLPGSRPAGPAGSAAWSGSTGSATRPSCARTAPTSWSPTWPSCWRRCSSVMRPHPVPGRAVDDPGDVPRPRPCWPSPSRCSRCPTGTSGCAATSTRASRTGSPAPT